MKFVALISGGKDSFYSAMEAIKHGHEMICGANLAPELDKITGNSPLETDSYMYQSAGHEVVLAMADCLQVLSKERPLFYFLCISFCAC